MRRLAIASASGRASVSRTAQPAIAATCAMPCPIVPAPMTATGRDGSIEADVLKIDRLLVDPAPRRCNPVGELAVLDDAAGHHRLDEGVVRGARHPRVAAGVPLLLGEHLALRADVMTGEVADLA